MPTPSLANIPLGLCQCGCNRPTRISLKDDRRFGHVVGMPLRYLNGHNGTQFRPNFTDAVAFKIDGGYCKLIPLTKGQFHVIDEWEYERVNRIIWTAHWNASVRSFYAWNRKHGWLHKYILGFSKDDPSQVDHVDPSKTWDNRHKNLRPANQSQQNWNTRRRKDNTSGYKGVCFDKGIGKYFAQIMTNKKKRYLGCNDDPAICAKMYEEAARIEHGEFARMG